MVEGGGGRWCRKAASATPGWERTSVKNGWVVSIPSHLPLPVP